MKPDVVSSRVHYRSLGKQIEIEICNLFYNLLTKGICRDELNASWNYVFEKQKSEWNPELDDGWEKLRYILGRAELAFGGNLLRDSMQYARGTLPDAAYNNYRSTSGKRVVLLILFPSCVHYVLNLIIQVLAIY